MNKVALIFFLLVIPVLGFAEKSQKAQSWAKHTCNDIIIYGVVSKTNQLIKIDPKDGSSVVVGDLGINIGLSSLSYYNGVLIGCSFATRKPMTDEERKQLKALPPEERRKLRGVGQKLLIYSINEDTGVATIKHEITMDRTKIGGVGVGFEACASGGYFRVSNSTLQKISSDGVIKEIMSLKEKNGKGTGSYCLGTKSDGKLIGINMEKQIVTIDPVRAKRHKGMKLPIDSGVPSLALTKDDQVYFVTFKGETYYMSSPTKRPKLLGKTALVPWGIAIKECEND